MQVAWQASQASEGMVISSSPQGCHNLLAGQVSDSVCELSRVTSWQEELTLLMGITIELSG